MENSFQTDLQLSINVASLCSQTPTFLHFSLGLLKLDDFWEIFLFSTY